MVASCSDDKCKLADSSFNCAIAVVRGDLVFKLDSDLDKEVVVVVEVEVAFLFFKVLRNLSCSEIISDCCSHTFCIGSSVLFLDIHADILGYFCSNSLAPLSLPV